ncbi:MAG: hypothetical protein IT324_24180 [Anaerolineae bacterium]|nr:hypothetical protein [Anaerolineae bacterium]
MPFIIDHNLLKQARAALSGRHLYWIIGGAASGKTTICQALAAQYNIPLYDMDAHIYGTYHSRFMPDRHPVNKAWSTAENGLAWLLSMHWDEFDSFNRAAIPEYLDLLADDLAAIPLDNPLLIDGGISTPAVLAQVIPAGQMICLAVPDRSSVQIWEEIDERKAMKDAVYQLPNPAVLWGRFLEFDDRIDQTMLAECQANHIPICIRTKTTSVDALAGQVAHLLNLHEGNR